MRITSGDYEDEHDFIHVRCGECQRLYWTDGDGCPRCAVCVECGEPSGTKVCEECAVQPGICRTCGDDAPHGEVVCDECLEHRAEEDSN